MIFQNLSTMKKVTPILALLLASLTSSAQISFTDATNTLNNKTLRSGVAIAITDMDKDGLDDLIRLDDSDMLEIEFQQADGTFVLMELGDASAPWGIAIADVDGNGYNDIIAGGYYDGLKLSLGEVGSYSTSSLSGPDIFLQNANFADIDNDGAIDFFGCHDDGISSPYRNDGAGGMSYDLNLINTESTVQSDNSGNYGSIWTDYDNDGDVDLFISKCRQFVTDPNDGRRLNLLFRNDGGTFTEVAEDSGLQPKLQSWSTAFDDIDNDGDFDAVMVNHGANHIIYENNGDGTFADVTTSTGIESELLLVGYGIQVAMEDFDNDGFIDIIMTTTDGDHKIFMNNGDFTFTTLASGLNTNGNVIQSAAVGDLNNDGFIDIAAGYADGFNNPSNINDQLFLSEGNDNNWTKIILEGVESNINGIGARVEIEGVWGKQTREVRAGESYGTQNSLMSHFGIGTATEIDKLTISWPSGIVDEINNPNINENITVIEGASLGINDNSLVQKITLTPNPATNIIEISLLTSFQTVELNIYDLTGKLLRTQDLNGTETNQVNISALTSGMYFASIGNKTIKFVKN